MFIIPLLLTTMLNRAMTETDLLPATDEHIIAHTVVVQPGTGTTIMTDGAEQQHELDKKTSCPTVAKKPATVLVYMAADNSLNDFAFYNLQQAIDIGSNERINILVYLNIKTPELPKVTRKLYIQKGNVVQEGDDMVRDSGDEKTLIEACEWALTHYPSDQFTLILWNHGSGAINREFTPIRSVCYDDTTGNSITDAKMASALSYVVTSLRNGKKIDIVAFDACLEAGAEVLDTIAPYAQYAVASEQTIPGTGYNYTYLFKPFETGILTAEQFAKHMVAAYAKQYSKSVESFTLAAHDLNQMANLSNNIEQVGRLLNYHLQGPDALTMRTIIKTSSTPGNVQNFDEPTYIDLMGFYQNLANLISNAHFVRSSAQGRLLDLLHTGMDSIKKIVIANTTSKNLLKANGISIYLPQYGQTVEPGYANTLWAKKGSWLAFLRRYLA